VFAVHSQNRVEQQLGRANLKMDSLPSANLWRLADAGQIVSRLLVLRSTRATRELVSRFEHAFRSTYPASAASVPAALVSQAPWPGLGVLWAVVSGDAVRILDHPPRGIGLGR